MDLGGTGGLRQRRRGAWQGQGISFFLALNSAEGRVPAALGLAPGEWAFITSPPYSRGQL